MGRTTIHIPILITITFWPVCTFSQQLTPVEAPPDAKITGRFGNEQSEKRAPPDPAETKNGVFKGYRHEVKEEKPAWFHQFDKAHGKPATGLTLSFFHVKFSSHLEESKAVLYLNSVCEKWICRAL